MISRILCYRRQFVPFLIGLSLFLNKPYGHVNSFSATDVLVSIPIQVESGTTQPTFVEYQFNLGDSLAESCENFCVSYDLEVVPCRMSLFYRVIDSVRKDILRIPLSMNLFDPLNYTRKDGRTIVPTEELSILLQYLCDYQKLEYRSLECAKAFNGFLETAWDTLLHAVVRLKYRDIFVERAREITRDMSLIFLVNFNPSYPPIGIGNALKEFISALSIHENTKIESHDGSKDWKQYANILDPVHIYNPNDSSVKLDIDDRTGIVNSWRWLLLRDEERFFNQSSPCRRAELHAFGLPGRMRRGFVDSANLAPLYSTDVAIDFVYDRASLPSDVVRRILRGVRSVRFLPHILSQVNDVTDSLIHPAVSVSVRSWAAAHEKNEAPIRRKYDPEAYMRLIRDTVVEYGMKSVLIAFDNPELLRGQFSSFLDDLKASTGVQVFFFDFPQGTHMLEKAAVEMLSLGKTAVLIGDPISTFLELVYWFGECRQIVKHPY